MAHFAKALHPPLLVEGQGQGMTSNGKCLSDERIVPELVSDCDLCTLHLNEANGGAHIDISFFCMFTPCVVPSEPVCRP